MPQTQAQIIPQRRKSSLLDRLAALIVIAETRRRDRRHLGALDAHLLRDIGLDENSAQKECGKPFWRP